MTATQDPVVDEAAVQRVPSDNAARNFATRPMTGAEAVAAVDRLTRLAGQAGGGGGVGQRGGRRE